MGGPYTDLKGICMEDLRRAESLLEELKYMQTRVQLDHSLWRRVVSMATAAVMVAAGKTHEQLQNAKIEDDIDYIVQECHKYKVRFGPQLLEVVKYSYLPGVIKGTNTMGFGGLAVPGTIGRTEATKYLHACMNLMEAKGLYTHKEYINYVNSCIGQGIETWLTPR